MKYLKTYEASLFPNEYPTQKEIREMMEKHGLGLNSIIIIIYETEFLFSVMAGRNVAPIYKVFPLGNGLYKTNELEKKNRIETYEKYPDLVDEILERYYGSKNVYIKE